MKTPPSKGSDKLSTLVTSPRAGATPAEFPANLIKKTYKNIPLSIPEEWCLCIDDLAEKFGNSRNGILLMAIKIGGPILCKQHRLAEKIVRDACANLIKEAEAK